MENAEDLEFTRAPRANLATWEGVKTLLFTSCIVIAVTLSALAFFLL